MTATFDESDLHLSTDGLKDSIRGLFPDPTGLEFTMTGKTLRIGPYGQDPMYVIDCVAQRAEDDLEFNGLWYAFFLISKDLQNATLAA